MRYFSHTASYRADETDVEKSQGMPKARPCLATVLHLVTDYPDHDATRFQYPVERLGNGNNIEVVAVIRPQGIIRWRGDDKVNDGGAQPVQKDCALAGDDMAHLRSPHLVGGVDAEMMKEVSGSICST